MRGWEREGDRILRVGVCGGWGGMWGEHLLRPRLLWFGEESNWVGASSNRPALLFNSCATCHKINPK